MFMHLKSNLSRMSTSGLSTCSDSAVEATLTPILIPGSSGDALDVTFSQMVCGCVIAKEINYGVRKKKRWVSNVVLPMLLQSLMLYCQCYYHQFYLECRFG